MFFFTSNKTPFIDICFHFTHTHTHTHKRSCGKVVFLHLFASHAIHRGACMAGGASVVGGAWQGVCISRGHAWRGVCMAGGMHDRKACMAGKQMW